MLADESDAEENAVQYCVSLFEVTRRGGRTRSRENEIFFSFLFLSALLWPGARAAKISISQSHAILCGTLYVWTLCKVLEGPIIKTATFCKGLST